MLHIYILEDQNTEIVYNVELYDNLSVIQVDECLNLLIKLVGNTYNNNPFLKNAIEYGPKLDMKTPWCSNVLNIFNNCGCANHIKRIEKSIRTTKNLEYTDYDPLLHTIYETPLYTFDKEEEYKSPEIINMDTFNPEVFNIDKDMFDYYKKIFHGKRVTNIELFDLAQSNSEHSRHHFFNGKIKVYNNDKFIFEFEKSLMDCVKTTNLETSNNIISFSDNASAIRGYKIFKLLTVDKTYSSKYSENEILTHLTHNAETHNFPTGICPFPGAATGTGGRIRDTISIGRGGGFISGIVGYSVGDIYDNNSWKYPKKKPIKILIEASNGASDYGNKIGEPVTLGYTRSFGQLVDSKRIEYVKPILYSASNGYIYNNNIKKEIPEPGYLIVRVGGPAYSIGIGGGSASSKNQDSNDQDAVQRGDPEMENKLCKFVRACCELEDNPILSLHDQGSGGMANVTKEIVEPFGGMVSLDKVTKGQQNISSFDIWNAEYQEQCTFLTTPKHVKLIKSIANRENVTLEFVGYVSNTGKIQVCDKKNTDLIVDMNLKKILKNIPTKKYKVQINKQKFPYENPLEKSILNLDFEQQTILTLKDLAVCSKKFLTNKVDRSVTGLISQQQCVGPFQLPLSNYSITNIGFKNLYGIASSIGEQPIKGIRNIKSMIDMTLGEMLTNLIFVKIESLESIKVLTNWMWSINIPGQDYLLVKAANYLTQQLNILNIGIDGGKDSLFMNSKVDDEIAMSPNTLVLKSIAPVKNILKKVTPNIKKSNSVILFIHMGNSNFRLGGSIFYKMNGKLGNKDEQPRFENIENFWKLWKVIQQLIDDDLILSGHDRSDGGLITTLIEMTISSYFGMSININEEICPYDFLFNEELGLVLEVENKYYNYVMGVLKHIPYKIYNIGRTTNARNFDLTFNDKMLLNKSSVYLWKEWEVLGSILECEQCDEDCAEKEFLSIEKRKKYEYYVNSNIKYILQNEVFYTDILEKYNVGVVRTNGSNGEIEMANVLSEAGFTVFDITMDDIIKSNGDLIKHYFKGLVFVGGFSYSDVFGSSKGWALSINSNKKVKECFDEFYNDKNKFSIGVCNGCQLLSNIGWIPNCKLIQNNSNRFESRYVSIKVVDTNNIFTKNMENIVFGMWSAHGEGQFEIDGDFNAPLRYVDDDNNITEEYPFNPNGSVNGIAALCSNNGNHIGIMPHPERSYKSWQVPYITPNIELSHYTPWYVLFKNAYFFVESQD